MLSPYMRITNSILLETGGVVVGLLNLQELWSYVGIWNLLTPEWPEFSSFFMGGGGGGGGNLLLKREKAMFLSLIC